MYGTNSRSVSRSLSPASGSKRGGPDLSDILQRASRSASPQPREDHAYALPKLGALEVDLATNFIIHVLQPSDTVAGLALTYGVTVESIKRQNKLYSTDSNSLFLRKSLTIPTTKDQVRQRLGTYTKQKKEKKERQEECVAKIMQDTGATKEVALSFLKQANGNVDEAIEKLELTQVVNEHAERSKAMPKVRAREDHQGLDEHTSLASTVYGAHNYHNSFGYSRSLEDPQIASRVPRQTKQQLARTDNAIYGL